MHSYLSEGSNTFRPLYQSIFRKHLLLYHHVIYVCKIGLSLVVLDYKTCPVSVIHLLKFLPLFCTLTTACNNVVFPHPLSQLNPLYRRQARNPWRCFVITCKMLGSALFCPLYHHFEKLKRTYKTLILLLYCTCTWKRRSVPHLG